MKVFRIIGIAVLAAVLAASMASAQTWTNVKAAPQAIGPLLQLRDGRILAHSDQGGNANAWYILSPASDGSYENGTWTGPYNMQSGYSPFFFSSVVMLDGKTVLIEGGEYNNGQAVWTTLGSLGTVTPFGAVTWVSNSPPSGWGTIGDAQNVLMANGTFMQANCCTKQTAFYNGPNSWTAGPNVLAVRNDESAYTALPDGRVLMVDVQTNSNCGNSTKSTEYYDPNDNAWHCGPQTTQQLWQQSDQELGSATLFYPSANHPQGGVFQYGGNVVATNVLDIASNTWATGPTLNNMDQADGPGALEPNGLVLVQVSPGLFNPGCQFQEYDPVANTLAVTASSSQCPGDSSYEGHMMIFPTGQIGSIGFETQIHLYQGKAGIVSGVAPTILASANYLAQGSKNNVLYGKQLNGLTENNAYGDDYMAATNYPLVQFTDVNNGNVYFAWTHDDSNHSIAQGTIGFTKFDLNPSMPVGTYNMVVITNGIKSNAIRVGVVSPHLGMAR
jgi:hypothetical protein